MELCAEGTLESLVELSGGLFEGLTRRFTVQLLSAVAELHKHGVVHRDIKTANIFLTNGGNCLKLGDFGSAVKIQAHTTVPGELQGYVGTQAYMAPEVFTKTNTDGHGRAADVWSVGCVVIEMASGKVRSRSLSYLCPRIYYEISAIYRDPGHSLTQTSKSCSKLAWAKHQKLQLRFQQRVTTSWSTASSMIHTFGGLLLNYYNIISARSNH